MQQVARGQQDRLERPERQAPRVGLDPRAQRGQRAQPEQRDRLGQRVFEDLKALRAQRAIEVTVA